MQIQPSELKEQIIRSINDFLGPPTWVSDDMSQAEADKQEQLFLRDHAEALKVILEVVGQHLAVGRFYEVEYPTEVLLQTIVNSAESFEQEHMSEGFEDADL